ncbi:hypothetical protein RUM44_003165 [Polyplax serrata]|uniref:Uncharacterized protein n=1 Tax=Polyplax serrata TaxID=468196 RepID=A0ABR1AZJ8_POLSC
MKKRPTDDESDEFDVDEPEEFEESGSDWDPDEEEPGNKRKAKSKLSQRKVTSVRRKKAKKQDQDDESDDNDDSEQDSTKSKLFVANGTTIPNISVKGFTNGSFVVLKADFESKDYPPLWKIDGKALLQKYIPFEQGNKTLYKNTSTYSGWTPSNQSLYAPASVTYVQQNKKDIILAFNRDKTKQDCNKEDEQEEKKKRENEMVEEATVHVNA